MKPTTCILACLTALAGLVLASPLGATDRDGPNDCQKLSEDYGDAPECVLAYPSGIIGQFPTCTSTCGNGDQEVDGICPPISTPPLHTGWVKHQHLPQLGQPFWLGCYSGAGGALGIDTESDGDVNIPPAGTSACNSTVPSDCVATAFGLSWSQDECLGDGSDAGLAGAVVLQTCRWTTLKYSVANCGPQRQVFLNILIDFNADGDWNDNFLCPVDSCTYEWVVKNASVILAPGCNSLESPLFKLGPFAGPSWMRLEIAANPVPDDFPWNGSAGVPPNQILQGGETEDYPTEIATAPVGVGPDERRGAFLGLRSENPVRSGEARIAFRLEKAEPATVEMFDVAGHLVRTLERRTFAGGVDHVLVWDGTDDRGQRASRGVYFYRVRTPSFAGQKKLVLLLP